MKPIDRLVELSGRKAVERLTLVGNEWREMTGKKVDPVHVTGEIADPKVKLWWAHAEGKQVRCIQPATQIINLTSAREWARTFAKKDGIVRGAHPGPAVLGTIVGGIERWFGVVHLKTVGNAIDPSVSDCAATELTTDGKVHGKHLQVMAPTWEPTPLMGGVFLGSGEELFDHLRQILQPEVIQKVQELADLIPQLLTRLEINEAGENTFEDKFIDQLLQYPSFRIRLERTQQTLAENSKRLHDEAKLELARLRKEIEDLRQRKRDEILGALNDVIDDDRLLALSAVMGGRKESAPPDFTGIEGMLKKLADRPLPQNTDFGPLIAAFGSIKPTDLKPLVTALDKLATELKPAPESAALPSQEAHQFPWLEATGDKLTSCIAIAELEMNESQSALAIAAHAGRLPVAFGSQAAETVLQVLKVIVGGRASWWSVPADASDISRVLKDVLIQATLLKARDNPAQLFAVVLEGIDRAPTEAYLEPLLVLRSLGIPFENHPSGWPKNALLFGTASQGGQMILSISAGCWERILPVQAESKHHRGGPSEIAIDLWLGRTVEGESVSLDGLLPSGIVARDVAVVSRSAKHLGLESSSALTHGLAMATCRALGDGIKPVGGVEKTFSKYLN
jgi:hypothetical protein